MLLLLICFVAGVLTVLAPCVLPLLPIIVGGSLGGNAKQKSRPYIIAASLAASIVIFTLALKVSTSLVNLPPNILTDVSGAIIIALGLVSIFPEAWEKLMVSLRLEPASQMFLARGQRTRDKYLGPILIGVALGPVFSSCSPTYAFILASVLPRSFFSGLIYLIVYALALVITLLMVALAGRKYIKKLGWAVNTHGLFRRALGVIFVIIGLVIISGNQIKVEAWIANRLPFDETRLEQTLLAGQHKSIAPAAKPSAHQSVNSSLFNVQATPAPDFVGLTNWINSGPQSLASLRGKVVLVDFWTYSCVNCNRALPYVETWYKTYKGDGLVVVGVHTPEFAFEHNPANVQKFVKTAGITYPVALDNSYYTWGAFQNNSWPADYLIDKNGDIRYVKLGEGDYDITEKAIQALVGVNSSLQTPNSSVPITSTQTPETYFGANRKSGYSGTQKQASDGGYDFTPTPTDELDQSSWTLAGKWQEQPQFITSKASGAALTFKVAAKDVYLVAGTSDNQPKQVSVGLPAGSAQYGPDDPGGQLTINGSKLYHIVSLAQFGSTTVQLTLPAGVSLYTFTFGS